MLRRFVTVAVLLLTVAAFVAVGSVAWLWRDRPALQELPIAQAETLPDGGAGVSVTWLGVSSLLFDDGETQILIDAAFTRIAAQRYALLRPVASDVATINYAMDEYRIDRLAAIVPVHAHIDHAIDVGRVANRSTALVLGSESIANIARGAEVPVDQFQILANGESRVFGNFTITLLESRHVPTFGTDSGWPDGVIEKPLSQPTSVLAYRGGAARSILIGHPNGTALVQGSAGFIEGVLDARAVDVAFLSIAGLAANGADYTKAYWDATVMATGAQTIYAVHFDDFTRPFGEVSLFPRIVDDVVTSAGWIRELAANSDLEVRRPPFGMPIKIY